MSVHSRRGARIKPSWPYMICAYLNTQPEKTGNIRDIAKNISQTYYHKKGKMQDLRAAIMRASCHERHRHLKNKTTRFIRCLNTDTLILTDQEWIDGQNELRRPQIVECKTVDGECKTLDDETMKTRSQTASELEPFGKIQVKIEGAPKPIVEVISLISDDEDDNSASAKSSAVTSLEWTKNIKCPLCNATFLTYEGVGVHVQMHR